MPKACRSWGQSSQVTSHLTFWGTAPWPRYQAMAACTDFSKWGPRESGLGGGAGRGTISASLGLGEGKSGMGRKGTHTVCWLTGARLRVMRRMTAGGSCRPLFMAVSP